MLASYSISWPLVVSLLLSVDASASEPTGTYVKRQLQPGQHSYKITLRYGVVTTLLLPHNVKCSQAVTVDSVPIKAMTKDNRVTITVKRDGRHPNTNLAVYCDAFDLDISVAFGDPGRHGVQMIEFVEDPQKTREVSDAEERVRKEEKSECKKKLDTIAVDTAKKQRRNLLKDMARLYRISDVHEHGRHRFATAHIQQPVTFGGTTYIAINVENGTGKTFKIEGIEVVDPRTGDSVTELMYEPTELKIDNESTGTVAASFKTPVGADAVKVIIKATGDIRIEITKVKI